MNELKISYVSKPNKPISAIWEPISGKPTNKLINYVVHSAWIESEGLNIFEAWAINNKERKPLCSLTRERVFVKLKYRRLHCCYCSVTNVISFWWSCQNPCILFLSNHVYGWNWNSSCLWLTGTTGLFLNREATTDQRVFCLTSFAI